MSDHDQEAHQLLVAVGVDGAEEFVHHGPDRIRAAIYRMKIEQKGKGFLIRCLREGWGCPPPPAWWSPFALQSVQEQQATRGQQDAENRRAAAAYEETRRATEERWQNARPLTQAEFETLWLELADSLLHQMTPGEVAMLSRLREERQNR